MRLLCSYLIFVFQAVICFAQADSLWNTHQGGFQHDYANAMRPTDDGGLIVVGTTASYGSGAGDVWLLKYDSQHELIWSRTFGGSSIDQGWGVRQTVDGGYVIAGMTQSSGAGNADGWLIKTDAEGNMIWNQTFGSSTYDWLTSVDLAQDDGFILGGIKGTSNALDEGWLIKTDSLGNVQWQRTYGWNDYDQIFSVIATDDGGYAMTGNSNPSAGGRSRTWVVRTNESGDSLWSRVYGGDWGAGGRSIVQTFDGGFAVGGTWREFHDGDNDFRLIRIDADGDTLWTGSYGNQYHDECNAMIQTSRGEFILAGHKSTGWSAGTEQFWFVKTDSSGGIIAEGDAGGIGQDIAHAVAIDGNGHVVLAGETHSFGAGMRDVWLVGFGSSEWLELTAPNGGEEWNTLNLQTIQWNSSDFGSNVNIRLNRNYPNGAWEELDELMNLPNTGLAVWYVSGAASSTCRFWIESAEEHSIFDISDADFSITRGSLRLSETELDFDNVPLNSAEILPVLVINDGPDSLAISGITSNHADFSVENLQDILRVGESRVIEVTFTANAIGLQQSEIQIQSSAGIASINATATGVIASAAHDGVQPQNFEVLSSYPNPFNNTTTLAYSLPHSAQVSLRAFDLQGRLVEEIASGQQTQGKHRVLWDCSHLATGTYLVVLSGNGFQYVQKAILMR